MRAGKEFEDGTSGSERECGRSLREPGVQSCGCHTAGLGGGPGEGNGVLSWAHGEAKGLGVSIL